MTLKERWMKAKEEYRQTVENWNTLIERNVSLPECAWDNLYKEMEEAADAMKKAWKEYMNKELFA